jgi:hypothetical protein
MRYLRDELSAAHVERARLEPQLASDAPVEIRLAEPADAEGLAHCFYLAYGDS